VDYVAARNGERRPPRFDTLDPTLRSIATSGDGLAERVAMQIGLRLPVGIDVAALRQTVRGWGDGAEVSFPYSERPFRAEKNTPVVRALLRGIRAAGGRPRFKLKTGTSDMNVVGPAWGCAIVAYGPGDSALDHAPDERIDVGEFRKGVAVLAQALREL
jgi:LysW-gamma-L-lysine carboxypeptidase